MAWQVHLLDQFTQVGEVKEFELVEVVERDLAVGSWRLQFGPSESNALIDQALNADWLAVEVVDTSSNWRFRGTVTQRRRRLIGDRTPALIELRGVDAMDVLASTVNWPDPADYTNLWQTTFRNEVLAAYVRSEIFFHRGAGAIPERRLTGLNVPLTVDFGPLKNAAASRRPLIEMWEPWFKGTPWTMRANFLRAGAASTVSEIRFEPAQRALTNILITPENHPGEIEIIETAASATHVVAMGAVINEIVDPNERFTAQAQSAETSWQRAHRERFLNRPSGTQAEIDEEVLDVLTSSGPQFAINASDIELPVYGTDVLIGDYVTVAYDGDTTFQSPIAEVKLTGTTDGWSRTASIGDAVLTPPQLLNSKITTVADQVRRIEGSR